MKKYHVTFFVILSISLFSQPAVITKIHNTNLFELDNNRIVKLYGLYIPALHDSNEALAQLSKEILNWESDYLVNRSFNIDYIEKDNQGYYFVKILRSYAFSENDIAKQFLSNGYAYLLPSVDDNYSSQLTLFQERAQRDHAGIWDLSQDPPKFQNQKQSMPIIPQANILSFNRHYEHPYMPLLVVSVASLALAWDNFASASDIQNSIDLFKEIYPSGNTKDLEDSKMRKTIVGITCVVAGVITTIFAFQSVEIQTNLQSVSMRYNF